MDHRRTATALATAAASALLLVGCTGDAEPAAGAAGARPSPSSPSSAPSPASAAPYGLLGEETFDGTCTEIGNAEGVGVDLSTALPQEGGDYYATVRVPSSGVSSTTGFAGNDSSWPGGGVEADLTAAPVTVVVTVADEAGREVYRASGLGTPRLYQPNGPECDGENYFLSLVATPDHHLVARDADDLVVKDSRGRWSAAMYTGCGITDVTNDSTRSDQTVYYTRVGGPLVGEDGRAPAGWNRPFQRGWVSVDGDGLRFEDERGHVERFERAPAGYDPPQCPHGMSE